MNQEFRTLNLDRVALRSGGNRFVGHAAVFNTRTMIGMPPFGFAEQVAPKAFDRALREQHDVRLLVDHEPSRLLARTASGTMQLRTDKQGLLVEADLAETSVGKDVRLLLERGDLSQMSFGFVVTHDEWEQLDDGTELRTIHDVDLFDVSIVTYPAYAETNASLRSTVEAARRTNDLALKRLNEAKERFSSLRRPE